MTHQPIPPGPPPSTPSATPTAETVGTLDNLHPDQLRIGDAGVFAGSWAWTGPDPATMRIPVGYAGRLEDWWNGWAVWSTTRDVIDAMVAEQHRLRRLARQELVADGHTGTDLQTRLDGLLPPMYLDGADLVVDEYANYEDDPLVRISPGHDGRYISMGWHWTGSRSNPPDATASSATSHRHQPADPPPERDRPDAATVARDACSIVPPPRETTLACHTGHTPCPAGKASAAHAARYQRSRVATVRQGPAWPRPHPSARAAPLPQANPTSFEEDTQ